MRTIKSFILFGLALIAVASCNKDNSLYQEIAVEINPSSNVNPNPSFIGTYPLSFIGYTDNEINAGTKTSLDGTAINWAANEGIYLFDGVAPRAFTSTNGDVASVVNFTGSASSVEKYYAVYPAGTISTVDGKKVIATTIPTFQTATADSFASGANVAVAYSETAPTGEGALQFKNIGAVVKFKIHANNTDVRKVRLDALNGEKMSGAVNVTFESDGSFNSAIVPASAESCVILESATDLNPANTYFMVVNPRTYAGGFKITLFKEDGSFRSISNATSNTLSRNDLMDFGTLPEVTEWYSGGVVDVLTRATTGIANGSGYDSWSNKEASSSARYAGNSAGGNDAIQLRSSNSNSGIVTTTSGGKASKVSVVWNSNTAANRTIDIYAKNTAYSAASDLYGANSGTKIGSISYGTATELEITGDYTYIGLRSNNNALYLDSVSITWGDPSKMAPADPDKVVPSTAITNVSSTTVGLTDGSASFDVSSNVPWTISVNQSYASVSVTGSTVTVNFENLASGSRNATVTISPYAGDPVSQEFTQSGSVSTEYDFSAIPGFSGWGNSYSEHEVAYSDATVTFAAASKQKTGTITDIPVTKGSEVTLVMNNNAKSISNVTFNCRQWATKAQTITLHYSTNGGTSYSTTGVTSTTFTISKNGLPAGTNAVKITFSSASNQVGIESVSFDHN